MLRTVSVNAMTHCNKSDAFVHLGMFDDDALYNVIIVLSLMIRQIIIPPHDVVIFELHRKM